MVLSVNIIAKYCICPDKDFTCSMTGSGLFDTTRSENSPSSAPNRTYWAKEFI